MIFLKKKKISALGAQDLFWYIFLISGGSRISIMDGTFGVQGAKLWVLLTSFWKLWPQRGWTPLNPPMNIYVLYWTTCI
jgi:hypothetical protein